MQRFGMMIRLKPGGESSYKQRHAAVWPEVLEKIRECNIENYSIYLKDNVLFSYFEYQGNNIKSDWEKMASDPKTQEWWATMEEVFHLETLEDVFRGKNGTRVYLEST
jgi:L-rhamnose mutarotase